MARQGAQRCIGDGDGAAQDEALEGGACATGERLDDAVRDRAGRERHIVQRRVEQRGRALRHGGERAGRGV